MYCVNCGVKLEASEKKCPLCGVVAFHPDMPTQNGERLYPDDRYPVQQVNRRSLLIILTTLTLLPILITLLCDLQINARISWSGYVVGALMLMYEVLVLPMWFCKPNPVIFVPCGFVCIAGYVMYINYAVGGKWFFTFALPLIGMIACVVTALVVLLRYVRRGRFFIFGGTVIALGGCMPVMELLIKVTFGTPFAGWSFYPLIVLALLGGMLVFLGINRSARESMERKLFI